MHSRIHPSRRCAGFTLVEVLVAVLVLTIGLLGIAKLSLSSLQANGSAYMRSQASALIQEIIDDMRANRIEATTTADYQVNFGTAVANPGADCSQPGTCTTVTQVAKYDLYLWKQRLSTSFPGGALPNGDGEVLINTATVNGQTEITAVVGVEWNDSVAQCAFGASCATPLPDQTLIVETQL